MKNLILKPTFLMLIALTMFSCGKDDDNSLSGSENLVTITRELSSFNKINAGEDIVVNVSESEVQEVTITVNENLEDKILTAVSNNTLNITIASGSYRNETFIVDILIPDLERIEIDDDCSGIINFNLDQLEIKASDDAELKLIGTAETLIVDLSDDGEIYGFAFSTEVLDADVEDGSELEITCATELNGSVKDGSRISYRGNPTINATTSDGGEIVDAN